MDPQTLQTLLIIIAVFVGVAAIALVIQAAMLIGVYTTARALQKKIEPLVPKVEALVPKVEAVVPKVESLIESARSTIETTRVKIDEIGNKTTKILDVTHGHVEHVGTLMHDATSRARVQLDRAEMVIDDAMGRAQDTVALVHGGVVKPIREVNAIISGFKASIRYLLHGRQRNPAEVTADEEMFI